VPFLADTTLNVVLEWELKAQSKYDIQSGSQEKLRKSKQLRSAAGRYESSEEEDDCAVPCSGYTAHTKCLQCTESKKWAHDSFTGFSYLYVSRNYNSGNHDENLMSE
jgi:hypothetical protein